jgi:hypothetical protein
MSLRNKIIIKVDLGTLKVLVEAHESRVEFVRPDDRKIYSGPLDDIVLTSLASM